MGRGSSKAVSPGRKVVYHRHGYEKHLDKERNALNENFTVVDSLSDIRPGDRVLCRFSMLPFSDLLEEEVTRRGGELIQTPAHHRYLSDMRNWYPELVGLTPKTWFSLDEVEGDGPFFVKGELNSLKDKFLTHSFASTRQDLQVVIERLQEDPVLSQQGVVIREFVPLRSWGEHPEKGLPIAHEYRFFVAKQEVVSAGFYWSDHAPSEFTPDPHLVPKELIQEVISRVGDKAAYYTIDVAETKEGDWIVIELNDATMSGLSSNDAQELYAKLARTL